MCPAPNERLRSIHLTLKSPQHLAERYSLSFGEHRHEHRVYYRIRLISHHQPIPEYILQLCSSALRVIHPHHCVLNPQRPAEATVEKRLHRTFDTSAELLSSDVILGEIRQHGPQITSQNKDTSS